jgi:hypothetical protein
VVFAHFVFYNLQTFWVLDNAKLKPFEPFPSTSVNQLPLANQTPISKTKMVFRLYSPGIKVAAVQMLIQNQSFDSIRISLGKQISRQSFN